MTSNTIKIERIYSNIGPHIYIARFAGLVAVKTAGEWHGNPYIADHAENGIKISNFKEHEADIVGDVFYYKIPTND